MQAEFLGTDPSEENVEMGVEGYGGVKQAKTFTPVVGVILHTWRRKNDTLSYSYELYS